MKDLEQPKIDVKKIQERANEAAEKAYLKEVENYYTSYDSPYRKMIKENLEKQELKFNIELPNLVEQINDALSKEIDSIANSAIANSYIPMVSDSLVGLDKEIKMSYLLEKIIKDIEPDRDEFDEFSFSFQENKEYGWLDCTLYTPSSNYEFTLHTVHHDSKEKQKYQLLSFPINKYKEGYNSNMTIFKGDVKIEMPFAPNVLQDKVLSLLFRAMIANSHITMDCGGFSQDMFPTQECFC